MTLERRNKSLVVHDFRIKTWLNGPGSMPQKSNVKRSFVTRAFFFSIWYKWFLIFLAKLNVFPQQVMIVMTHMTNYGNDQLALYTISRLVDFVYRWTNLELKYASPLELADIYFKLFPQDKSPVWLVSCRWTMILLRSSMDGSTTAMSGGVGGGGERRGSFAYHCGWDPHTPWHSCQRGWTFFPNSFFF